MRRFALLYSRDDPVEDVAASPSGALRMIAICCAEPFAPCTKGSLRGCTEFDVLLVIHPPNVVGEKVVEIFGQLGLGPVTGTGGIPPLQLASGTVNFTQKALPIAVATL